MLLNYLFFKNFGYRCLNVCTRFYRAGKSLITLLCLCAIPLTSHAVENDDAILSTFDQFVVSETAVKHCLLPNQEQFSKFDANFDVVTNFAFQELSEKYPYVQRRKISETLALKARALTLSTQHKIRTKGCEDPDIQNILQRYQLQASWDPAISF